MDQFFFLNNLRQMQRFFLWIKKVLNYIKIENFTDN